MVGGAEADLINSLLNIPLEFDLRELVQIDLQLYALLKLVEDEFLNA